MSTSTLSLGSLPGDYRFQADFVVDASWRLQAMQDMHSASPSRGCFHYAYWRDKTSEFPDARFQEAGATLGLLSLPFFDDARTQGRLDAADVLYAHFAAAIDNLGRQQYAEGTFDEWYKGERGFAATEFTTIAYGLAARCLGDRLATAERRRLSEILGRAAGWLARRADRIKANHHAAAAAALALAADVTGDSAFTAAAHRKVDEVLERQHSEGWFPEVGGMDLGYCSVLLDYLMIYTRVTGDERAVPATRRLMSFMFPLLQPDGAILAEMGICLNPYVSRLGMGLLSVFDDRASALANHFRSHSPRHDGLRPYLADDLRLARWSHLPLATALMCDTFRMSADAAPLSQAFPQGWTWWNAAAVGAYHRGDTHVYVSGAGGGQVRVFHGEAFFGDDHGVAITGANVTGAGYDPQRPIECRPDGVMLSCDLGTPQFMQPGFVPRLLLRLGSTTRLGSRLTRAAVDYVRVKRRTAANQSAAPMSSGPAAYRLTRLVTADGSTVQIDDRVTAVSGTLSPERVVTLGAVGAADASVEALSPGEVALRKTWRRDAVPPKEFRIGAS